MDNSYENNSVCHDYNEIKYWRGEKINLTIKTFVSQLKDIITENTTCNEGYKQCGYLNKEKDKLCLRDNETCPINKIIIMDENITPTDFDYYSRKIGNKYLFYTNQNINNSIYINIIADSGINSTNYTEVIDNQSLTDFLNENPYIYDGNYTGKSAEELNKYGDAKLKICESLNQTNLEELKKLQKEYIERLTLYSDEKLREMNENVPMNIKALDICNIIYFVYLLAVSFIAVVVFLECCYHDKTPIEFLLLAYLIFFPVIFFNIFGSICTIKNKIIYNEYYEMKFINDFIHCENIWTYVEEDCDEYGDYCDHKYWRCDNVCYFNKVNSHNNTLFIFYLIGTIFIVLYPIIIFSIYCECNCECERPKLYNYVNLNQKLNSYKDRETPSDHGKYEMQSTPT